VCTQQTFKISITSSIHPQRLPTQNLLFTLKGFQHKNFYSPSKASNTKSFIHPQKLPTQSLLFTLKSFQHNFFYLRRLLIFLLLLLDIPRLFFLPIGFASLHSPKELRLASNASVRRPEEGKRWCREEAMASSMGNKHKRGRQMS
jgi:hypothetical protein